MDRSLWFAAVSVMFAAPTLAQTIHVEARQERKSATEEEAAFRGRGDFLRDSGKYLESRSEAYARYQQAEGQRLENLRTWQRDTAQARYHHAIDLMERQLDRFPPRRLSAQALTPAGVIRWPEALLQPEFREHREHLRELFARRRASSPGDSQVIAYSVREATGAFDAELRQQVEHLPKKSYLEAARFLRNLAHESTFPVATAVSLAEK